MKRFRARAKGRAAPILKPYSTVTIILLEKSRNKGEEHVYSYEVECLKRGGRMDLAKQVIKQYEDTSSFPGYDIKSFNLDGSEIFIEVKSSASLKKNNFEITSNEINAAKKYKDKYFIYRVVNAKVNPKISIKIKNPWDFHKKGTLDIAPIKYKLTFQDD